MVEMGKPSKMNKVTGFLKESKRGCYCTNQVNVSQACASSSEGIVIHFLSLPHLSDIVKSLKLIGSTNYQLLTTLRRNMP